MDCCIQLWRIEDGCHGREKRIAQDREREAKINNHWAELASIDNYHAREEAKADHQVLMHLEAARETHIWIFVVRLLPNNYQVSLEGTAYRTLLI